MSPKYSESEKTVVPTPPNEGLKEGIGNGMPAKEGKNPVNQEGVVVSDEDSNTSTTNIFSDPEVAAHYVSVYNEAKYECRHVFDPDLEWTKKEEKGVIRKLDWHGKIPFKSSQGLSTYPKVTGADFQIVQYAPGPALCSLHYRLIEVILLKPLLITYYKTYI
jgi:hypothetical protein